MDPSNGLILLMALLQENKQEVQPVMDYHEHFTVFAPSLPTNSH